MNIRRYILKIKVNPIRDGIDDFMSLVEELLMYSNVYKVTINVRGLLIVECSSYIKIIFNIKKKWGDVVEFELNNSLPTLILDFINKYSFSRDTNLTDFIIDLDFFLNSKSIYNL